MSSSPSPSLPAAPPPASPNAPPMTPAPARPSLSFFRSAKAFGCKLGRRPGIEQCQENIESVIVI